MIKLHEESKKYIDECFIQYKKVENQPEIFRGQTVIHLYPTEDTRAPDGDLEGFIDALFFKAKFYMIDSKTVWSTKYKDEIKIHVHVNIRIFKDQSTMIIIYKDFELFANQSMMILPIRKENKKNE